MLPNLMLCFLLIGWPAGVLKLPLPKVLKTGAYLVKTKERIEALLPDKRKGKLTIEERAKYCAKTGDFIDIIANHWKLGPKSNDENEIVAGVTRQSTFRVKLSEGGVDSAIIDTFAKDK